MYVYTYIHTYVYIVYKGCTHGFQGLEAPRCLKMFAGKIGAKLAAGEPTLAKAAAIGEIFGSDPNAVVARAAPMYCDHGRSLFWEHTYFCFRG